MTKVLALKIILVVAIAGMLFSGYLSYGELIMQECTPEGCTYALGLPVCVYGFFMYMIITIVSILGLRPAS